MAGRPRWRRTGSPGRKRVLPKTRRAWRSTRPRTRSWRPRPIRRRSDMTLGRILWLFVKIAIVVTAAVLLADWPGRMSITWFGYNIDLAVGTAIALLVLFIGLLYLLWRLWHIVRRAPTEYGVFRRNRRQAKGFKALTRGLVAVAAGDPVEAKRLARSAHSLLEKSPLTLLLAAQA